jgi:hypothetical protein
LCFFYFFFEKNIHFPKASMPPKRTHRSAFEVKQIFLDNLARLGGVLIGPYIGVRTKVHCKCKNNHDCFPYPFLVEINQIICFICVPRHLLKIEKQFLDRIQELNFTITGTYVNHITKVECVCSNGHVCFLVPQTVIHRKGVCLICFGRSPTDAEKTFRERIESFGGIVIGKYVNDKTDIECECAEGHKCILYPALLRNRVSMCNECLHVARISEGKESFIEKVTLANGKVIGEYKSRRDRVECICENGHTCNVYPETFVYGARLCLKCVGVSFENRKFVFDEGIKKLGGTLLGEYENSHTLVLCKCKNGHEGLAHPQRIQQGGGFCTICPGKSSEAAAQKFQTRIEMQGGKQIGEYSNAYTKVECECKFGHICEPMPIHVLSGLSPMCKICFPRYYGETKIAKALELLHIPFEREFIFYGSRRRFDYEIESLGIIIEFDGDQHFRPCIWRKTWEDVWEGQQIDQDKMYLAFSHGYKIIQFDYTWVCKSIEDIATKLELIF